MFELGSDFNWFEKVSVEALSDDIRRSILRFIKDKLGFKMKHVRFSVLPSPVYTDTYQANVKYLMTLLRKL